MSGENKHFLKEALQWAWIFVQMVIEAIGFLVDIFKDAWFLIIIFVLLILGWYFGIFS